MSEAGSMMGRICGKGGFLGNHLTIKSGTRLLPAYRAIVKTFVNKCTPNHIMKYV